MPRVSKKTIRIAVSGVVLALALLGCGSPTGPTIHTPPDPYVGESAVRTLVEEILDTFQRNWLKRYQIDWTPLRAQVLARSAGAKTIVEAYPAIQLAFTLMDDPHARYVSKTGYVISSYNLDCSAPSASTPVLPAGIGYVRVGTTTNAGSFEGYAGSVQSAIRAADTDNTIGWIIDLRGNAGGSSYAMLAGVGPVLGAGLAGYFINPDGVVTEWGYKTGTGGTGAFSNGFVVVVPSVIYELRKPNPRVAVLSDHGNASAGEATLIAFIGRSNTRTFGTASCGVSTGNSSYTLLDGGKLLVPSAHMADRTGRTYGSNVLPDETITDVSQLIARVVTWLQTGQ